MKFRRTLSGLLFGLGCAIVFIGALAVILPRLDNAQLQIVLASFEAPSRFAVINAVNQLILFTFGHSWQVLAVGALCLILGVVLLLRFSEPISPAEESPARFQRPVSDPVPVLAEEANPFAVAESAEPAESSLLGYQRPLLEPNRIDENLPYLPVSFADESAAIITERGDESPSGARTILRAPQPVQAEEPVKPVLLPLEPSAPAEPAPVQIHKPAGSRIRSTMGQHKQW